jgi:N-acetylmuramoyl-L-alanine amidase
LAAIGLPTGKAATPASGTTSNKDLNMLARLVHGEARGEPYTGKVAVAAVVLNRTRDSRFPNTIAGVIYQPGAFTAVSDGQINLEPDSSAYKAARDALNGWDPSYGSLYYWNPATATSKWIWSRQIIVKIGKHYFGK